MSIASGISSGLNYVLPGYGAEGAPPGVAGPATNGQPVVYDPGTGLYVNQATGAVSTDAAGQQVVKDPSLATQATRNLATSGQFLSQLGQYGQQYSGAQAGENDLAGHLNATINGTAPSVAQAQLEQGLGQIQQQQLSAASGATGAGGALARQNAMANIGSLQAQTNQQQAGVRANEVSGAESALGGVLGNEAGQALTASGQTETAAGNFSQLAGGEQGNDDSLTQNGGQNQLTTIGTIAQAGGASGASNAGGKGAPATTSDEDAKTGIKPADMDEFMSKLGKTISFDYKKPGEAGTTARHVDAGVTAQNVKKSKVGKAMIEGSEPDMKLDNVQAISGALAGIADLHKRLKKVEARG